MSAGNRIRGNCTTLGISASLCSRPTTHSYAMCMHAMHVTHTGAAAARRAHSVSKAVERIRQENISIGLPQDPGRSPSSLIQEKNFSSDKTHVSLAILSLYTHTYTVMSGEEEGGKNSKG